MAYITKDYLWLMGIEGFSDQLLKNHLTLYQGYVNNMNKLVDSIATMLKEGKTSSPEYAELKRRLGFEFNGMRLHEYYFENLNRKSSRSDAPNLIKKIGEEFGSYETWEKDFKATGSLRGIGWAILYQDSITGRLFNLWINEHETGHPSGGLPLLVMDVFEHAYMIDYGLKRADYIESFFKNINWQVLEGRFKVAILLCK